MTTSIPTTEPSTIIPGDTVKWTKTLKDYPASSGWVLSYDLIKSDTRYTFSAITSGEDHAVIIPAATSAGYVSGNYEWRARVSKSGEVFTVGSGRITISVSFGDEGDARSQARRALQAIEDTLEGRASSATAEYEIAGRRMKYIPIPELLVLRDRYRIDVAREDAAQRSAAGLPNPGRVYVRHGQQSAAGSLYPWNIKP